MDSSGPLLYIGLALVAILYSSVGQAGASGYIAVMALLGVVPEEIKPTALVLNTIVSVVVTYRVVRNDSFNRNLFTPITIAAVPLAMVGGYVMLPSALLERVLGVVLLIAGGMLLKRPSTIDAPLMAPNMASAVASGAAIGLLSDLTGVGGGVLLAPFMIQRRWCSVRTATAISAPFILCNSLAALAGHWTSTSYIPEDVGIMAVVVVFGGWIGAHFGSRHLSSKGVKIGLGIVLLVAGGKLLLMP